MNRIRSILAAAALALAGLFAATGTAQAGCPDIYICANADSSGPANTGVATGAIAIGAGSQAPWLYAIALGDQASATRAGSMALGALSTAAGYGATALGFQSSAAGYGATALGFQSSATGLYAFAAGQGTSRSNYGVAIGSGAVVGVVGQINDNGLPCAGTSASGAYTNCGQTAIGSNAQATGLDTTAVGGFAGATGYMSTALGNNAQASGVQAFAAGAGADASGFQSFAAGTAAQATGAQSIAEGYGAAASGDGSLALGASASATGANSVALGSQAAAPDANTVSVGNPLQQRRIVQVAAGINPTDAVNLSQMQAGDLSTLDTAEAYARGLLGPINGRISDAFASGAAMAAMYGTCSRSEGDNCLAVGTGSDNGYGAIAVGYRHTLGGFKSRLSWDLGLSASGHDTTFAAGIGVSW